MVKTKISKVETMEFEVPVEDDDIATDACRYANRCMIRVASERALRLLSGEQIHHVRADGSVLTYHLSGYRWEAKMPKKGKNALVRWDAEDKARKKAKKLGEVFISSVKPFLLKFKAQKLTKLPYISPERQERVNELRRKRQAAGQKPKRYTLRQRIVGLA